MNKKSKDTGLIDYMKKLTSRLGKEKDLEFTHVKYEDGAIKKVMCCRPLTDTLVAEISFDDSSVHYLEEIREYDELGKLLAVIRMDEASGHVKKTVYADEDTVSAIMLYNDNSETVQQQFFGGNGLVEKELFHDPNHYVREVRDYQYNGRGEVVKMDVRNFHDEDTSELKEIYYEGGEVKKTVLHTLCHGMVNSTVLRNPSETPNMLN